MTQVDLARKMSVSPGNIGGWETGARNPSKATIKKLAKALEIAPEMLLEEQTASIDIEPSIMAEFEAWCQQTGRVPARFHALALWLVQRVVPECLDETLKAMDEGREVIVRPFSAAEEAEYEEGYKRAKALLEQIPEPLDETHKDAG